MGQKPFTSSHDQKEDNNQTKNNKQPEVLENQTAWNSDNQGIKETVNQTGQAGQTARAGLAERTWGEAVDHVGGAC